jgi:hypothetical protein
MPSRKRSRSPCKANQIRNPATGRCVKRNGSIGKKIRSKSRSPARRSPVSRSRCRSGYRKNRSGRCVKIRAGSRKRCSPGYKRSASGRCVRKSKRKSKSRSQSPVEYRWNEEQWMWRSKGRDNKPPRKRSSVKYYYTKSGRRMEIPIEWIKRPAYGGRSIKLKNQTGGYLPRNTITHRYFTNPRTN